jgi:hypothetical protein
MTRSEQNRIEKMRLINEVLNEAKKLTSTGHGDIKITCENKEYEAHWFN